MPQLSLSVRVSVQTPSQSVVDEGQPPVHIPSWQVWPNGQELPHMPQLELSVSVSVQMP